MIIPSGDSLTKTRDNMMSSMSSELDADLRITAQEITELNQVQRQVTQNLNNTMKQSSFHGFKDKEKFEKSRQDQDKLFVHNLDKDSKYDKTTSDLMAAITRADESSMAAIANQAQPGHIADSQNMFDSRQKSQDMNASGAYKLSKDYTSRCAGSIQPPKQQSSIFRGVKTPGTFSMAATNIPAPSRITISRH